jgi:hypothetical protein
VSQKNTTQNFLFDYFDAFCYSIEGQPKEIIMENKKKGSVSQTVISRTEDLRAVLNGVDSHGMARVIAKSDLDKRLTKKSRADKSPRPDWMVGLYRVSMFTANVMHDYNQAVKNQVEKSGSDPNNFQAEASKISEPDPDSPNGIVRQSLRDPNQKYVRVFVGMGPEGSYSECYINGNGEDVTKKITDEIKANFFPVKSGSEKQMLAGSEKEVKPREYKAENVIYFQKGDSVYNTLSDQIKETFGLE